MYFSSWRTVFLVYLGLAESAFELCWVVSRLNIIIILSLSFITCHGFQYGKFCSNPSDMFWAHTHMKLGLLFGIKMDAMRLLAQQNFSFFFIFALSQSLKVKFFRCLIQEDIPYVLVPAFRTNIQGRRVCVCVYIKFNF